MYKFKRENETQNKVAICTKQNVNIPKVIWITPILTKLKKENLMLNVMANKWNHCGRQTNGCSSKALKKNNQYHQKKC